jgi:hypothetical protein
VAILVVTALLRIRLLGVPLERDEGEYAYVGQLILQREVPYLAARNMKLPGVYYAYAPNGPRGWASAPYLESWELQLGALLEGHAREGAKVPLPDLGRVNAWENMPVVMMEGWR